MMICDEQIKTDIYSNYYQKVLGYIIGKVNNTHIAEDICSDVFLKIYEKINTFDETKSSVSTWIFTVTRNTLTDYYRTRKVNAEIPEELAEESCVEDDVCNAETLDFLASALAKLGEYERDVIIFHYYKGMNFKDISERMDLSYSYIKYLHNKALGELKNYF